MTRLELRDGELQRFWEVERDGTSLVFTTGRIGWRGSSRTKAFQNAATARAEMDRAVQTMQAQGYLPVREEPEDDVMLRVAEDPDDLGAVQVFADHLQSRGDPLGEWIALHVALDHAPSEGGAEIEQRISDYRSAHGLELFGAGHAPHEELELGWRWGLISSINLPTRSGARAEQLSRELGRVLQMPVCRLVQRIHVRDLRDASARLVSDLVKAGRVPSLRVLRLNSGAPGTGESIGTLSGIYQAFPRLEELDVVGARMVPGGVALEHLTRLRLATTGLMGEPESGEGGVRFLGALRHARTPCLEDLDLDLGLRREFAQVRSYRDQHTATLRRRGEAQARAILESVTPERFPALSRLAIRDHFMGLPLILGLLQHPILTQLRSLSLTTALLGRLEADALVAEAPSLSHLESIDLSDNVLSDQAIRRLRRVLPQVIVDDQTDLGHLVRLESRYTAITE